MTDIILPLTDMIQSAHEIPANSVFVLRTAQGWSQAELAHRAGISRAAVSAIEGHRLTPSVSAAISLARAFECSVEELFGGKPKMALGAVWAWQGWENSCRYWEAEVCGKRILYPVESLALNQQPQDGLWENGIFQPTHALSPERTLTVATCDPAIGLLAREYERESGFRLLVFPRNGSAALHLAKQKLIHMAALHRSTDEAPQRNAETVRLEMGNSSRLLRVARWESGVALASNNRTRSIKSLPRLIRQWAAREPGSAARESLNHLLNGKTPEGRVVESHQSVSEAVRAGWAEAGVCVKFSAVEARLNFLQLQHEDLDFCFHGSLDHDPRILALIRVLRSRRYRQMLSGLPGYDARTTGELRSL